MLEEEVVGLLVRDQLDFKTIEQDTGTKWINGKAIYQKTLTFVLPRLSSGTVSADSIFFKRHDATNIYGYVGT